MLCYWILDILYDSIEIKYEDKQPFTFAYVYSPWLKKYTA